MVAPKLVCNFVVFYMVIEVWYLDIRLIQHSIQVLVQSVQQKSKQFLRILLQIANEMRVESLKSAL